MKMTNTNFDTPTSTFVRGYGAAQNLGPSRLVNAPILTEFVWCLTTDTDYSVSKKGKEKRENENSNPNAQFFDTNQRVRAFERWQHECQLSTISQSLQLRYWNRGE